MNSDNISFRPETCYMKRALQLAALGAGHVSPNPMVGAVIVADNRIIGEGWHRAYGGPHAEVNAVNSVAEKDIPLLRKSTIYVTLEPCSHYGKTPPCSLLLIEKKIPRIVVGCADPFKEVSGRGIRMLREANRTVIENFMERECRFINRRFITANTLGRPYIQLKWAETANGRLSGIDINGNPVPLKISTPLSTVLMHRERSKADAVMVGVNTVVIDNPRLDNRLWPGNTPRKISFSSFRFPPDSYIASQGILLDSSLSLLRNLEILHSKYMINSLMVEGGATLLNTFITAGLYDEIRVECNHKVESNGIHAPKLPDNVILISEEVLGSNFIRTFIREDSGFRTTPNHSYL